MQEKQCVICQKLTVLECASCTAAVCKRCAVGVDVELAPVTGIFCGPCFDAKVSPQLERHQEILERAKNVHIFFKTQGKETRLVKRKERPVSVSGIDDHDELLLRLAYLAAEKGYNAIVDVVTESQKAGQNSYKKLVWSGQGVPTQFTDRHIVHDKSIWHNPN